MSLPPPIPQQRGSDGSFKTSKSPGSSGSKITDSRNSSITHSSSGSSTNNANGYALLKNRLRSLLSHDLALPLFHALHGNDPGTLSYLAKESRSIPDDCGDSIFEEAVTTWVSRQQRTEPHLTHLISELIKEVSDQTLLKSENNVEVKTMCTSEQGVHVKGRIDILLSSPSNNNDSPSTPVALIEIGRKNKEWWKKLDRAGKCLNKMEDDSIDERLKFQDALLCASLTFEGEDNTQDFVSQFGVFLCWPNSGKRFRMTLLWKARTFDLSAASKDFGRFLRVVSSFAVWLKDDPDVDYVYLSSNVCRVGNTVLRCYDSRVRETERSPEIYLDAQCRDIVGGEVQVVVEHPAEDSTEASVHGGDSYWANYGMGQLHIIACPYKKGTHRVSRPSDFLHIIDQLEKLHSHGYVHGDIRGFNVLYGDEGGLIDFDFGGRAGKAYPKGYRQMLNDGWRLGIGDAGRTHNTLQFYHDWYALGKLMFTFHEWDELSDSASDADRLRHFQTSSKWNHLKPTAATDNDIEELKRDLNCFNQHWTVYPEETFSIELDLFQELKPMETFGGATGSPQPKNSE